MGKQRADRRNVPYIKFRHSDFAGKTLIDCHFDNCKFTHSTLDAVHMQNTSFNQCEMLHVSFRDASILDLKVTRSRIVGGTRGGATGRTTVSLVVRRFAFAGAAIFKVLAGLTSRCSWYRSASRYGTDVVSAFVSFGFTPVVSALLIVDLQRGMLNEHTRDLPGRINAYLDNAVEA